MAITSSPSAAHTSAAGQAIVARLRVLARELGFAALGVARVEPFVAAEAAMQARVAAGKLAGLPWFDAARAHRACHPEERFPWARSLVVAAATYAHDAPARSGRRAGRIARYAWGRDYHDELARRLRTLAALLDELAGRPLRSAVLVDTAALAEREAARRAGLGWFGKHSGLLAPGGSWTLLGTLVTELELPPDQPLRKTCGACTRCLVACPTGALRLDAPYELDNARCISYLTIEHRGPIPRDLRPLIGDWLFGCDICQEVCPVNRRPPGASLAALAADAGVGPALDPSELLGLDEAAFRARFRHTPLWRPRRRGLLRNACVVLGNLRDPAAVPALCRALDDAEPLVRGHAAWALGRIGGPAAAMALQARLAVEEDAWVREELALALEEAGNDRALTRPDALPYDAL
jgi:epoxyqueuosine reductase